MYFIQSKMEDLHKIHRIKDIRSLDEALKYFNLLSHYEDFQKNLQDVSTRGKSVKEHESSYKYLNETIEFKFAQYQMNNLENKELKEVAKKLKISITVSLCIFNTIFMKDVGTDFDCNESKRNVRVFQNIENTSHQLCELFFRITMIEQEILFQTSRFINQGQYCLMKFLENDFRSFKDFQALALFHLRNCVKECEKLCMECKFEPKNELENFSSASFLLSNMLDAYSSKVRGLKKLKKATRHFFEEKTKLFICSEEGDGSFLLPFECYINLMLMCSLMTEDNEFESKEFREEPIQNKNTSFLLELYYLMQRFREVDRSKINAGVITMYKITGKDVRKNFQNRLFQLLENLEREFNKDIYANFTLQQRFVEYCTRIVYFNDEQNRSKCLEIEKQEIGIHTGVSGFFAEDFQEKIQELQIPVRNTESINEGERKDGNNQSSLPSQNEYKVSLKSTENIVDLSTQSSKLAEPCINAEASLEDNSEAFSKEMHDVKQYCGTNDQDCTKLNEVFESIRQNTIKVNEFPNEVDEKFAHHSRQHESCSFETNENGYDFQKRKEREKIQETETARKRVSKGKFHNENTSECECKNHSSSIYPITFTSRSGANSRSENSDRHINHSPSFSDNVFEFNQSSSNDIKTLEDALEYFDLFSRFKELEKSLEDVRRNKNSIEDHESFLKQFDKELQRMSMKYHPDKVKNRGGSEKEVEEAHELQTSLNATRTVLSLLNKIFLENLDIDYRYEFFSKLNISALGNEDDVENHIYDVLFKICFLSEIKQLNIIAEIRKFLIQAQDCLKCFLEEHENKRSSKSFASQDHARCLVHCFSAMNHLKKCIQGYEKLIKEFKDVEEAFKGTKSENVVSHLRKMRHDSQSHFRALKRLHEVATRSLREPLQIFRSGEPLDDYFVLPFVRYVNAILMCHAMTRPKRKGFFLKARERISSVADGMLLLDSTESRSFYDPIHDEDPIFSRAYYLASYYSGNKQHKSEASRIMEENEGSSSIEDTFLVYTMQICFNLEDLFKIDDYKENSTNTLVMQDLKKCMQMMATFRKNTEELAREMSDFKKESQGMRDDCDRMRKEEHELSREVQERLELSDNLLKRLPADLLASLD